MVCFSPLWLVFRHFIMVYDERIDMIGFIIFIVLIFLSLGIWFIHIAHKQYEIGCAIADFCYTIGTGKDPDEDE